jgi:hypothetical protein
MVHGGRQFVMQHHGTLYTSLPNHTCRTCVCTDATRVTRYRTPNDGSTLHFPHCPTAALSKTIACRGGTLRVVAALKIAIGNQGLRARITIAMPALAHMHTKNADMAVQHA